METNALAASPAASADTTAVLPTASLPASVATPLITHIIIEDTNRKEQKVEKAKQMSTKANLVQTDTKRYKHKSQNSGKKPKISNPHAFKKRGTCLVCGKPSHHASQCRKRVKTGNSGNPLKANLVEGDDIIAVVISQANMVTNSKN